MGYLSTPYAWRVASASFAGATIERLQYRGSLEIAIRFADWRGRSFNSKALEIGEDELLVLIGDAVAAGVLSRGFVNDLRCVICHEMSEKPAVPRPVQLPTEEEVRQFREWINEAEKAFGKPPLVAGAVKRGESGELLLVLRLRDDADTP